MSDEIAVNLSHPDPDGHFADIAANVSVGKAVVIPKPHEGDQSDFLGLHFVYLSGKWEL